jgi:hypothetical protein
LNKFAQRNTGCSNDKKAVSTQIWVTLMAMNLWRQTLAEMPEFPMFDDASVWNADIIERPLLDNGSYSFTM